MQNAGYIVALVVTVLVLAMLLGAAYRAAHRIEKRRGQAALVGVESEVEPDLPFEEPAPAAQPESRARRLVDAILDR